jgi:hypothetical protein
VFFIHIAKHGHATKPAILEGGVSFHCCYGDFLLIILHSSDYIHHIDWFLFGSIIRKFAEQLYLSLDDTAPSNFILFSSPKQRAILF